MYSNWPKITIEDIAFQDKTAIAIGPFGSRMKSDCYVNDGIPVIRGQNITDGMYPEGDFVYITKEKANELKSSQVFEGDLVFPHRGAIGKVALVKDSTQMILSSSLMKLTPDKNKCSPEFLLYFFRSRIGKYELLKNASTVGTPGIGQPLSSLKSISVPLPPLVDQKAIAHILGKIDKKIELNKKTNKALEEISKNLFKSWFIDFDPVKAKSEGRSTGLPDEISELFPDSMKESELGRIPNMWSISNLGECSFHIESGKRPKGGIQKGLSEGIPSIGAESIDSAGLFDFRKINFITEEFAYSSKKGWVKDFDVALYKDGCGKGGEPGKFNPRVAIYGNKFPFKNFMVNEHVFLLRSNELGQPFLYNLLDSRIVREQIIQRGSSKGAQPGLNQKEVTSCIFIKPNQKIINLFNEISITFLKKQFSLGKKNISLIKLRDTLLPKLISGEIKIPDPEKIIDEVKI